VAVVGAEWLDALDSGRWYSLLGPLLGRDLSVEGILIGPRLEDGSAGTVKSLVADATAFERATDTLQHFLQGDGEAVDVAVLFQPGLDDDTSLLEPPGLAPLLEAGIPVLGSSYSGDEFRMEREILRAFGYASRPPVDNPLALDPGREEARWGSVLWALERAGTENCEPDREKISDVRRLSRMLAHSKLEGMLIPLERLGESFGIPRREGGEREVIYLFDVFYAARDTGEVFQVDGNALRPTDVRIKSEDMHAYPAAAEGLGRALWAARMKEEYLLRTGT